jgi:hypothetical protein
MAGVNDTSGSPWPPLAIRPQSENSRLVLIRNRSKDGLPECVVSGKGLPLSILPKTGKTTIVYAPYRCYLPCGRQPTMIYALWAASSSQCDYKPVVARNVRNY